MRKQTQSDAMLFSLSELAFVLLFLAIGAAVMLFQVSRSARAEAEAVRQEKISLQDTVVTLESSLVTLEVEVEFLQKTLDEFRYGVVPCWRRPDKTIPLLVGSVAINNRDRYTITRNNRSTEVFVLETEPHIVREDLTRALVTLFEEEINYAAANRCYLRMAVTNDTNSFVFYQTVAEVVTGTKMVVASE